MVKMVLNGDIKKVKASSLWKNSLPIVLFLFGAALRIFRLGTVPDGYQMDEAYAAWNAFSLYHSGIDSAGHSYPVYFEAWGHGQNALNSYLMLPFLSFFGGQMNPLVLRLPQLLISLATLAAIYALVRKMYNPRTALWALFLLAICPWHVMMSRWGLESNLAPGFLILGLCFFLYGLEKPPFLLLSALCYALSLYCYAIIWTIVPVILLMQGIYSLYHHKLRLGKYLIGAILLLGVLAFPLVCFLLVNVGWINGFQIGPFSIYKMTSFRGNELAHSFENLVANFRNMLYLFHHQDVGRPYDVIMPYGFFYEIGRIFIFIGILILLWRVAHSLYKREFSFSFFLLTQLIGAGIIGILTPVNMTQINCAYIPLVLCEAVGVNGLLTFLLRKKRMVGVLAGVILLLIYLGNTFCFQRDYYTSYRELVSAYFQQGTDEAVKEALHLAKENNMCVSVDAGLKYPNVLLAAQTTASEYLANVIYSDAPPAPSQFTSDGITFHMGINLEQITTDQIYIVYQTDIDKFTDFETIQFYDWYVAVPK